MESALRCSCGGLPPVNNQNYANTWTYVCVVIVIVAIVAIVVIVVIGVVVVVVTFVNENLKTSAKHAKVWDECLHKLHSLFQAWQVQRIESTKRPTPQP